MDSLQPSMPQLVLVEVSCTGPLQPGAPAPCLMEGGWKSLWAHATARSVQHREAILNYALSLLGFAVCLCAFVLTQRLTLFCVLGTSLKL